MPGYKFHSRAKFKGLKPGNYRVKSPDTPQYNCIAFAAGDDSQWWEPDALNLYYWPPGVPRDYTSASYVAAYRSLGYQVCQSPDYEEGFEKIVIYQLNGIGQHAAMQISKFWWKSKLGRDVDIEHKTLAMGNPDYGAATTFMRRPKPTSSAT